MVGDWVKAEREKRGWSQRGLAQRAGLEQSYLSKLERNKSVRPGADIIQRLATSAMSHFSQVGISA